MHKPSRGYSRPHSSLPNVRPQNAPSTSGSRKLVLSWALSTFRNRSSAPKLLKEEGRMGTPHTQPPAPTHLPQGPPVPAVPSAQEPPLDPTRGMSASARPPQLCLGGSAACTAPPKSARHPWEGAASTGSSRARVSSPPEAKASWVRSSYGVSFGTRGPLHPSGTLQRSTPGGGSAAPCPSAYMGGSCPSERRR